MMKIKCLWKKLIIKHKWIRIVDLIKSSLPIYLESVKRRVMSWKDQRFQKIYRKI